MNARFSVGQSSISLSKDSGGKPHMQGLRFGSPPSRTLYGLIGLSPALLFVLLNTVLVACAPSTFE